MAGIKKVENEVLIGEDNTPWDGRVIDLQYSISFESASSLTVTVANKEGEYPDPILDAHNPTRVQFGNADMKMLPVSYRKSRGAGGRTLRVDFEDMGLRYLDKNIVLLKDQHLNAPPLANGASGTQGVGGCTIVLGKMFADDVNGLETRYYGLWKSGLVRVKYDIRDLAQGIHDADIPISKRLYNYLLKFRAYPPFVGEGAEKDPPNSFLRTEVGPLRDVLGSVSNELGFVFFWNNADGIDESFGDGPAQVENFKEGEGFLDFVEFKGEDDTDRINFTIDAVSDACNVEDDSYEVSIKDSYIKGGIGFFAVEPTFNVGGSSSFKRFKFLEKITSPYDGTSGDEEDTGNQVNVSDPDVKMLMKAALVGPNFYARYVMQKLTAYYIEVGAGASVYETLKERTQGAPQGANPDPFSRVGPSVLDETANGEDWKINTVPNDAITQLYASEFVLIPCIYSKAYAEGAPGPPKILTWRESRELNDNLPPANEEYGTDDRWMSVFEDDSFIEKLRETSEFVGVAYTNNESIRTFLENPDKCPVYQQAKFLAENYGKWYSLGRGSLIVESTYGARRYQEDTSFVFSDLAVTESPMADIFSFTYSKMDQEEPPQPLPLSFEEAVYKMVLAGQSNCGNAWVEENVISPGKRTISTEIDRDDGVVESYKDIIGIRAMLKSNLGANAAGGRTGCKGGADDDDFIDNINDTNTDPDTVDGFVVESLLRRSNTNTDDGGGDDILVGQGGVGGFAKSITSAGYSKIQEYRSSCDDPNKCPPQGGEAQRANDEWVCFAYPTDKDYGVVLHDASLPVGTGDIDGEITYTNYGKGKDVGGNDLWYKSGSAYFGLEVVQLALDTTGQEEEPILGEPEVRSTQFGRRLVDWWDWQLDNEVTLAAGAQRQASNSKTIGYTYTVDFLLQSLRAAFIPEETAQTNGVFNFSQAGSIEIEEVEFQIGEVVKALTDRFEFPLCDETASNINFQEASDNLIKIMKNYVELNISQAISRDFVVSGYGFNVADDPACETVLYLPNILQGLESISMSLSGDSGVRTTIKIGNKRRKRASAQLRREMIVRNMPVATSRALIPNPVNNAFSVGVQART